MSADIIDIHTRAHIFQRDAEQATAQALFDQPETTIVDVGLLEFHKALKDGAWELPKESS